MLAYKTNDLIFSPGYRVLRHSLFWLGCFLAFSFFWSFVWSDFGLQLNVLIWLPALMLYSYPVAYAAVPRLLLKSRYALFIFYLFLWGFFGWYLNIWFRIYVFFPFEEWLNSPYCASKEDPSSLLCMTTTAALFSGSILLKNWILKQRDRIQAEKEKANVQLQLLKAQLHPHFLFNTLNNIYSFALECSSKTPEMVLRLSSLLSYMLYDCKADEVLLEKELEVMKNYIDLEKERYGDKIDISVNIEGDIQDKYITPLLILPFLENAFKHGTSEQLERPWMSVDIAVKDHLLRCKVVNSKNEFVPFHENGVGINNVRKRLEFLYPGKHDLKLTDEGDFFVVSLLAELKRDAVKPAPATFSRSNLNKFAHQVVLSPGRL